MSWFNFSWQNFWFSYLALAFEGLPFVLVGAFVSGVIAAFVPSRTITRFLPKNHLLANLMSGLLGLIFPVCECGIVPVVRRLLDKGLPFSCGVTYMLASPIVNPLVIISTYAAFRGQAPELNTAIRLLSGYCVAVLVGLSVIKVNPARVLRTGSGRASLRKRSVLSIASLPDAGPDNLSATFIQRLTAAIQLASEDFIDTAIYFMIGAAVAAVFNTAIDQKVILPLANNILLSTTSMMGFSAILTLCSTSDAFIAVTFVSFPIVARMAFLVFGPMFDLKLFFLYSVLFRKRFVVLLGIGLFVLIGIISAFILPQVYAFVRS